MKYFIKNNTESQEILFIHGYHWSEEFGAPQEVKYLEYPYLTFSTQTNDRNLYHCGSTSKKLIQFGFVFVHEDQLRELLSRSNEQIIYDHNIINKIPSGITKFTYNNINYELKEVTEKKWVMV